MSTDKNEVTTTKERVIKASETCPDAKEVLEKLFPEVFECSNEWKDITKELQWGLQGPSEHGYFLYGTWMGQDAVYVGGNGYGIAFGRSKEYEYDLSQLGQSFRLKIRKKYNWLQ